MSGPEETLPVDPVSRRRGIALVLVVFVLGLVCGAALSVLAIRATRPPAPSAFRGDGPPPGGGPGPGGFERMAERLELSEDQRRRVREIMHESRGEVRGILERSREEIRAILDDEQREAFDRMRERRGPEFRRRRPGGRRGPGGPAEEPPPPGP